MRNWKLRQLIFWALCCDIGFFSKQLLGPIFNPITDALHIPGGITTSVTLGFLLLAAELVPGPLCCAAMGAVQCIVALAMGKVGKMGALAPIAYIVPGLLMDGVRYVMNGSPARRRVMTAAALGAACAAFLNHAIAYHLPLPLLALYLSLALVSGAATGWVVAQLTPPLRVAVGTN